MTDPAPSATAAVPPIAVEPGLLDALADRGWPALERASWHDWSFRFSGGVTDRANSVLPSGVVPDVRAGVDAAEAAYAERGLRTRFQVSPATDPRVTAELRRRGYEEHSPTRILVAGSGAVAGSRVLAERGTARGSSAETTVTIADAPDRPWMDAWWSVDGRGGASEREVAARILTGVPALYASLAAPAALASLGAPASGPATVAVARLALVDAWGGLFAVATSPDARRRGFARRLIVELAAEARDRGIPNLWLQVTAANTAALRLYAELGFAPASSYAYWAAP